MPTTLKQVTGDCEFCSRTNVVLTQQHGDMMCSECITREAAVVVAVKVVEESRKIDSSITLKSDIWNAETVAFHDIQTAILNNPDVPADQKNYALAQEAATRIDQFNAAIFGIKDELAKIENKRNAWLKNTQNLVATLKTEQQEKFRQYALNYKPQTPTVKKPKKTPVPSSAPRVKHSDLAEACKKYGVRMDIVKMTIMQDPKLSVEQAAKRVYDKTRD